MDTLSRIEQLRSQISDHEAKLTALKAELLALETEVGKKESTTVVESGFANGHTWPLLPEEYTRYGRQMILPGFGLPGQLRLRASRILIVGVGGLGCPAAIYLASAGVGTLGLVDGDVVELSNLHRQILHSSKKVGMKKVNSAVIALESINPHPTYITYPEHLDPATALDIFPFYDLILDCTDTPQTRYLISDTAVLCGKAFISASALKTDGQLMVLNHPPTPDMQYREGSSSGPCYRCIFPRPPPPESVISCGEGGILGPVVGVMGVLMALEAIKLISSGSVGIAKGNSLPSPLSTSKSWQPQQHSMIMLTASSSTPSVFRSIRLKGKRSDCATCSPSPRINAEHLRNGSVDYAVFCGAANPVSLLPKEQRIDVEELSKYMQHSKQNSLKASTDSNRYAISNGNIDLSFSCPPPVILDVRDEAQFSICSLPGSINIPWNVLQSYQDNHDKDDTLLELKMHLKQGADMYTICRLGNDSQLAVRKLEQLNLGQQQSIKDVLGGFKAWKQKVDKDWPEY